MSLTGKGESLPDPSPPSALLYGSGAPGFPLKSLLGLLSLRAIRSHQVLKKGIWGGSASPPFGYSCMALGVILSLWASHLGLEKDNNEFCPILF